MSKLSTLKICFLAGTLGQGGAERQLYYVLRSLKEHGADVKLLCLTRGEFWEQPIREMGIPVVWVGKSTNRIVRLFRIFTELKDSPPDVFHSQHFYTNFYVSTIARLLRSIDIGSIRNDGAKDLSSVDYFGGLLCLYIPKVLAVNSENAICFLTANKGVAREKLIFLSNVVDQDRFTPSYSPESENEDVVRMVSTGRLVPQKRFDRLLRIAYQLKNTWHLNVQIDILGDGPDRNDLEKLAAEMQLSNVVIFRGAVADVNSFYQKARIFVLTSDWEGTPNVILEAMACGLPVVATRVGGIPEIVQDGETGLLIDPENEQGMATAIYQLILEHGLRREFGRQGRHYIERKHSLRSLTCNLENLYGVVLK
jgi:glycosyltransferase involved in cell wall biosynthesis